MEFFQKLMLLLEGQFVEVESEATGRYCGRLVRDGQLFHLETEAVRFANTFRDTQILSISIAPQETPTIFLE